MHSQSHVYSHTVTHVCTHIHKGIHTQSHMYAHTAACVFTHLRTLTQVKFSSDHSSITAMTSMEGEGVELSGGNVHVTEAIESWLSDLAKWVYAPIVSHSYHCPGCSSLKIRLMDLAGGRLLLHN